MTDGEDLIFKVGASASKESVKKAVDDVIKTVESSLGKDGRIDIPVDIKIANIKNANRELKKAQDELADKWNSMLSKGLSASSEKDKKELDNLFNDFYQKVGKQHLYADLVVRAIKKAIKTDFLDKEVRKTVSSSKQIYDKVNKTPGEKAYAKKQRTGNRIKINTKATASDEQQERKLDVKGMGIARKLLTLSDHGGPYRSQFAEMNARDAADAKKDERKSLKVYRASGNTLAKLITEAESGKNQKTFTKTEQAKGYQAIAIQSLGETLTKIKALSPKDVDNLETYVNKFQEDLKTAFTLKDLSGTNDWSIIRSSFDKVIGKFYNTKGRIGIARDDVPKEKALEIEGIITSIQHMFKEIEKHTTYEAEVARQLKKLAEIYNGKIPNSFYKTGKISNNKSLYGSDNNLFEQYKKSLSPLKDAMDSTKSAIDKVEQTEEMRYVQDVRDYAAEKISNSAASKKMKSNIEAQESGNAVAQLDATTGFNTDTSSGEALRNLTIISSICEQGLAILRQISNLLTGKNSKVRQSKTSTKSTTVANTTKESNVNKAKEVKNDVIYAPTIENLPIKSPSVQLQEVKDSITKALTLVKGQTVKSYNEEDYKRRVEAYNIKKHEPKNYTFGKYDETGKRISSKPEPSIPWYSKLPTIELSNGFTDDSVITNPIKDFFKNLFSTALPEADRIMQTSAKEQAKLYAERLETFGENNGRSLSDTGDIAGVRRFKKLFNYNGKENPVLFQNIQATDKIRDIDTDKILGELNKVLSGSEMFKAQTGGGILRNILGSMTFYAGMPSLEKSRAQAEGLNQVMANVRNEVLTLLEGVKTKQDTLDAMQKMGTAKFNADGTLNKKASSPMADKLFTDLEEQKKTLRGALAEVSNIDKVVKRCGGKVSKITKQIGFVMPELKDQNIIIKNINSGLDKNGKALKFQSRTAEVFNYSLQLMSRHIGQMFKNWMMMLNPITQIKRAFQDFASYDVKWQRTMNVIKYNLQNVIRPFMQWIAQKLVNIIGFFDIILMKIQEAFNVLTPISLFDQSAANAEKMRRELEEAKDVSAGFDELHDIGTSDASGTGGADDLLGDIYKPQLSEDWKKLAENIGNLFKGVITGDLGFGEAMKEILRLALEGLTLLGETIWGWIKGSGVGEYLVDNWKSILNTLLQLFVAWQLFKIAGNLLSNLFTELMTSLGTILLSGLKALGSKLIGGKLLAGLGIGGFLDSFGKGIITAFTAMFSGGKYSLIGTLKEMFTNSTAITEAKSWGSMLGYAFMKGLAAILLGIGTATAVDFFGDKAIDNENYNLGLESVGGDDEDKKSNFGNFLGGLLAGVGGGAATGAIVGGAPGAVVGAAIGGIASVIQTVLRPVLEEAQVAARNFNNEMQSISYYEGQIQGLSPQVSVFEEHLQLLQQSLDLSTQQVRKQGEELGVSKTRMNELIQATKDGSFTTDMLTGSEISLGDSLTNLMQKQENIMQVTGRLEEAQKKLILAQTNLAIAQDVAAGNFEIAAARIEVAELQGVYTTEEATKRRIQLYKQCGDAERDYLLQNLTDEQRALMVEYTDATEGELANLAHIWATSSENTKESLLNGLSSEVRTEYESRMNDINNSVEEKIKEQQGFWRALGDTILEILSLGSANTWTYNPNKKYETVTANTKTKTRSYATYAVGTNYVPNDGFAYLHQGEAVIPKKYNKPYNAGLSTEEATYMAQMVSTMKSLDDTMKKGISVNGQFTQRGSDLVAVVNRTKSQTGADLLSNVAYAR